MLPSTELGPLGAEVDSPTPRHFPKKKPMRLKLEVEILDTLRSIGSTHVNSYGLLFLGKKKKTKG